MRHKREETKENPALFGIARRFSIDNPYFHDIIESFEGPLKVWCKGEKLEHDQFWQTTVAGRYAKRLSEAFTADIETNSKRGFLEYVLNPMSQGYQVNEWTEFKKQMKKIPGKYWTDEVFLIITKPEEVAKTKESTNGEFSLTLLEITKKKGQG